MVHSLDTGVKTYRIKKLFNGYASVRSTVIEQCKRYNKYLLIEYMDKSMLLSPIELDTKKKQFNPNKIISKFNGIYYLYDYEFTPNKKQLELF